ncbi:hypothetical protein EGR_07560 [Echinococcus granulosus]|uniref:Transmembrane protein n=1 Tax=Echinococcus granulosus TaxID=6210 RepID=W6UVT5_ECHGR|nr:hypothetical protein EGR_07560 [Echinococcus granulosus]EUB57549.1 hypothetical protein EGR_07560 [Echinococcus granulosus]
MEHTFEYTILVFSIELNSYIEVWVPVNPAFIADSKLSLGAHIFISHSIQQTDQSSLLSRKSWSATMALINCISPCSYIFICSFFILGRSEHLILYTKNIIMDGSKLCGLFFIYSFLRFVKNNKFLAYFKKEIEIESLLSATTNGPKSKAFEKKKLVNSSSNALAPNSSITMSLDTYKKPWWH